MPRHVTFKRTDAVRAVRAVEAAGKPVAAVEIGPDGSIKVLIGEPVRTAAVNAAKQDEPSQAVQEWLKKRGLS